MDVADPLKVIGDPRGLRSPDNPGDSFQPPAATWYDEAHGHFVALLESAPFPDEDALSISSAGITSNSNKSHEVYYQTLHFPQDEQQEVQNSLAIGPIRTVRLPASLAYKGESSTRIPILAKFSLDMEFLAVQYSPTMVRIVPAISRESSSLVATESKGQKQIQWNIDLAEDATPISCAPEAIDKKRRIFGKILKEKDGIVSGATTILPGGVLWVNPTATNSRKRSQASENFSILVLVTTTAFICYKISSSPARMSKMKSHVHASAKAFWYQPETKCLMVGSYEKEENEQEQKQKGKHVDDEETNDERKCLYMHTYFIDPLTESGRTESSSSSIIALPVFSVGSERKSARGSAAAEEEPETTGSDIEDLVVPSDISLFCIYGKTYCIELGALGRGQGLGIHHLCYETSTVSFKSQSTKNFSISKQNRGKKIVCVIDNLLCFVARSQKICLFVDLHDLFLGGSQADTCVIDTNDESSKPSILYSGSQSFLPPYFLLDPKGRGDLYPLKLDLERMTPCFPVATNLVPFFLHRRCDRETAHSLVLKRFSHIIRQNPSGGSSSSSSHNLVLWMWMDSMARIYARDVEAVYRDMEVSPSLLVDCMLLPPEVVLPENIRSLTSSTNGFTSSLLLTDTALTQTNVVERVLLPLAKTAIEDGDLAMMRFLLDICIDFIGSLESAFRHLPVSVGVPSLEACSAVECLTIALMWRLGLGLEVCTYLEFRRTHASIKLFEGDVVEENSNDVPYKDVLLAEIIIAIFTLVPLGINLAENSEDTIDEASENESRCHAINCAIDILTTCGTHDVAAKYMLQQGRIEDAIALCCRTWSIGTARQFRPPDHLKEEHTGLRLQAGIESKDFFHAAVACAKTYTDKNARGLLMNRLYFFFKDWQPEALLLEEEEGTLDNATTLVPGPDSARQVSEESQIMLSNLAHEYPDFPDEAFGGQGSVEALSMRALFGYNDS